MVYVYVKVIKTDLEKKTDSKSSKLAGIKITGPSPAARGFTMSQEFVLETRGLTKEFRGFTAVDSVNLQVKEGNIHALIGPNGAGKTTLFNLLTKYLPITRGDILYRGKTIAKMKSSEIARLGVVRSFQISAVFPHMTVLENVRVALQRPKIGRASCRERV